MEKNKKATSPEQDVKIVSRPSNEELSDDIVDEKNGSSVRKKAIKKTSESDFGEGVED